MQYLVRYMRLGDTVVHDEAMDAVSEFDLRAQLQAGGQTVLRVQAVDTRPRWGWGRYAALRATRHQFPLFCREVKTLIHAGMTIVEAIETLSVRERKQGRDDSLPTTLLARLQQGLSLSAAMSELPQAPAVLIAAVRAGERTSNLTEALDDYLRFDHLIEQLRKKVVSASIYPAMVTAVGLAISLFLLLVVMPNFAAMYENLRGAATGPIALTILVSQFVGTYRVAVFSGLAVLAALLCYWIVSGRARAHAARLGGTIPWVRRRVEDFQLAMMYQALALMLKGGYSVTEAMRVAGQSALSAGLERALGMALEQIERGGAVSQALAQAGLCDEVGGRLMAAAERNGEFHRAADVVSRMYGERFELFVERVTRIVEPLLLLAVALGVGAIVLVMYLPVFDMATQLR